MDLCLLNEGETAPVCFPCRRCDKLLKKGYLLLEKRIASGNSG